MSSNEHQGPRILASPSTEFVAVYKPSGYLVHSVGDESPDMVNWLGSSGDQSYHDVAFAHRLDKGVSGVLVGSANPEHRAELGGALSRRDTVKQYVALVYGVARPKGTIRRVLKDGRRGGPLEATTRYRRLQYGQGVSLLLVRPETGRKHQIRRHLQSIGHPIVGDTRYGSRKPKAVKAFPGRLWLHGLSLAWPEKDLKWSADIASELSAHLHALEFQVPELLFPEADG